MVPKYSMFRKRPGLKSFCCVFAKKHCIIPCIGKKCNTPVCNACKQSSNNFSIPRYS